MKLTDYITPEHVEIGLKSKSKDEVIEELVKLLVSACKVCDKNTIYEAVMDRERKQSTGLELGVAIPHAKCDAVERLSIVIGISKDGIDFEAQDGKPSNLFFLMIAPPTESGPHIQAIAKIVKMIKEKDFKRNLINARTPQDVIRVIDRLEEGEE